MITVLYHADADGFGAAYAIWKKYGHSHHIDYIKVQYGQPVPVIHHETQKLFIVDFSYDRETCLNLSEMFSTTIFDHHKTAEKELDGLDFAVFDNLMSGCELTWNCIFKDWELIPDILAYVGDRDLWKFDLPMSEEVNLAIAAMPETFEAWDNFNLKEAKMKGTAIKAFRDRQIAPFLKTSRITQFQGAPAVVVNCTANISETGHQLLGRFPDAQIAVMYADRSDGKRSYSLRSRGDFDVSEIAKGNGGGGHRSAAGFTVELED